VIRIGLKPTINSDRISLGLEKRKTQSASLSITERGRIGFAISFSLCNRQRDCERHRHRYGDHPNRI